MSARAAYAILLLLALSAPTRSAPAAIDRVRDQLQRSFDTYLASPQQYDNRALTECRGFPEGDLFPFLLPAQAYACLAVRVPAQADQARAQMGKLIELALPQVVRRVRPPGGSLDELVSYQDHATYLGQLNLALAWYERSGGGSRYKATHDRISRVLLAGLEKTGGLPLHSFPTYTWPFDTVPVLASLAMHDRARGTHESSALARRHLAWLREKASHGPTGLPFSRALTQTGWELPRGCDLSWRIGLLGHLDLAYARELYRRYVRAFWLDRVWIAGFAEWPGGTSSRADIDSGPIVDGVGMAATGLGFAPALAFGDQVRQERLAGELSLRDLLMSAVVATAAANQPAKIGNMIPADERYFTGFLFGDAVLFYALSFQLPE